jgi:hypothetical protein
LRTKLRSLLRRLRFDFEYSVVLVGAATIAILSLFDVIETLKPLVASTLAVLSLMAFGLLRQARRRDSDAAAVTAIGSGVDGLTERVAALQQAVHQSRTIEEIPGGGQRNQAFQDALLDPQHWHFRGSTGSFVRARTLVALAAASRRRAGSNIPVSIQILDPANREVCEQYVAYRLRLSQQQNAEHGAERWTVRREQLECLATLVAAAWFAQHEGLSLTVGLSATFSTLRFDLSDTSVIMTNVEQSYPALALRPESRLYFAIKNDLERTLENCRIIDVRQCPVPRDISMIEPDSLRPFLNGIGAFGDLTDTEIQFVIELAFNHVEDYTILGP